MMAKNTPPQESSEDHLQGILGFLCEVGCLKRVRRSGWWLAGINSPESVAEHSFRTAIIGLIIAELEGCNPFETASICLFHDLNEARLLDSHALAKKYLNTKPAEALAVRDSMSRLPSALTERIQHLLHNFEAGESLESIVARDADVLECLIQAREYQSLGVAGASAFARPLAKRLKTTSAKRLAQMITRFDPNEWWSDTNNHETGSIISAEK